MLRTQNECCVSMLRKLGNICCGHKMFLNKIRNIFCVRNNVYSFARALRCKQLTFYLARKDLSLEVEFEKLSQLNMSSAH